MSRLADETYERAKGLHDIGLLSQSKMDEVTVLYNDVPRYDAEQIKAIRVKTSFSQTAFARLLNVSPSSVRQWESGAKKPDGASRKLLQLLEAHGVAFFLV